MSTEPISAPDYPFRGTVWPQFSEKRHPDFRNRAIQSPIACLTIIPCTEKATFSNDAGPFPGNEVLGDDPRGVMKEKPWQRFRLSTVGRGATGGQPGIVAGPAALISGEKCTAGKFEERVKEMNP
jgi:hypothetical protein